MDSISFSRHTSILHTSNITAHEISLPKAIAMIHSIITFTRPVFNRSANPMHNMRLYS